MVENLKVILIYCIIWAWPALVVDNVCHCTGASTSYRLHSYAHRPPKTAEFRTFAVAYIPLQLTKSLSLVSLHLNLDRLLGCTLNYAWVYDGLGQFIPRGTLWCERV